MKRKANVLQGAPVAVLTGNEAPHEGISGVRQWAIGLFQRQGGEATHPDIGKVMLSARAVRDSMSHGKPSQHRHSAFVAVKDAIEHGVIVAQAHHDRDMVSYFISAPVNIAGVDNILTALVRRDPNTQRLYLHRIDAKENILNRKLPGTDAASGVEQPGTSDSGMGKTITHQDATDKLSFDEVGVAIQRLLRFNHDRAAEDVLTLAQEIANRKQNKADDA